MSKGTWKNDFVKTRYVMDLWLLIGFVLVCVPKVTGVALHEWLSFLFLVPFVIHLLLHWDWMKNLPKQFMSRLKGQARFNVIWDMIFYIAMMLVIISGILISEVVFPLFGIPLPHSSFWYMIHDTSSNLLIPMLGIHLALHWDWIKLMTGKMLSKKVVEKGVK